MGIPWTDQGAFRISRQDVCFLKQRKWIYIQQIYTQTHTYIYTLCVCVGIYMQFCFPYTCTMCFEWYYITVMEKVMALHSSTLAWKIPWTEEPGRRSPWGHEESDTTEQLHFHFHTLEKEMATHSSVLAWRIPGMGEPGGLPSVGSHRVGHDWSDLAAAAYHSEPSANSQVSLNDIYWRPFYISIHRFASIFSTPT